MASPDFARIFGSALADVQQRGIDFSPEAPWAIARSAFPEAVRSGFGATLDDVMREARSYLTTGAPVAPAPSLPPEGPSSAVLNQAMDSAAGTTGVPAGNPGGITGFDPGIAMTGLNVALNATGFPGLSGALGQAISMGGKAINAGRAVSSLVGFTPDSNLTALTPDGNPINVAALRTGFFDSIINAARGNPNFAFTEDSSQGKALSSFLTQNPSLINDPAFMAAPFNGRTIGDALTFGNVTGVPGFTEGGPHPAFGYGGFNAPSQTPNPDNNFNIFGQPRSDAPPDEGGKTPDGTTGVPGDPSGGVAGGAAPGGTSGGTSTSGSGDAFHRGGKVKGRGERHARVLGGEYVLNPTASRVAEPWLEALNRMVPPNPTLDALLDAARGHLEG